MANKKREAVHLFVVKGFTQKEIGKMLGISEKTIGAWARKYGWNDKLTKSVNIEGGLSEMMKRFFDFILSIKPEAVDSFKTLWFAFLKSEGKEM